MSKRKRQDIGDSHAEGRPAGERRTVLRAARRGRLLLGGSLVAVAGVVVAAAVLALGTSGSSVAPPSPSASAGAGSGVAGGGGRTPAPNFTLRDVDGKSFSLGAQRGNVVVIDFLQAGCPTCAEQVPILSETATRYSARGVKVVIVDLSGLGDRELRDYYRGQYHASTRVVIAADPSFRAASAFRLSAMEAFVVDRHGDISWSGALDRGALDSALQRALA